MYSHRPPHDYGPWNPGIRSQLPQEYAPLETLFRPENVSTSLEQARELSDFCGLSAHELVEFRPQRLITHELLIRVTADFAVPDGSDYEDLGINFRHMVTSIFDQHVRPQREEITRLCDDVRRRAEATIADAVTTALFPPAERGRAPRRSLWRLFGAAQTPPRPRRSEHAPDRGVQAVAAWRRRYDAADDRFDRCCYAALIRAVTAIQARRGRLIGDQQLITRLAVTLAGNELGSRAVGAAIEPLLVAAAERHGYRRLPAQRHPVVMNVKGASAAGKSTLRPRQKTLAQKLGIRWDDFALISPDIWRKHLLDYRSLGSAYKYAGTLTGRELEIVDKKLDGHMARKAARGEMTHLLIDRFRFDSFHPESERDTASRLLTRFGDLVYLFFMITPPHATVERAWLRGEKVGRYKAVDDLLDHNVEAYTGMPQLFFTWALGTKKKVHYEFLDNSVAEGERPRTVAFGWNGEMNVLDVKAMLDIDRFRKIDIRARSPDAVYRDETLDPAANVDFLRQCARLVPAISFAAHDDGRVYARLQHGRWVWRDETALTRALRDPHTRAGLEAIGISGFAPARPSSMDAPALSPQHADTLGAWGERVIG